MGTPCFLGQCSNTSKQEVKLISESGARSEMSPRGPTRRPPGDVTPGAAATGLWPPNERGSARPGAKRSVWLSQVCGASLPTWVLAPALESNSTEDFRNCFGPSAVPEHGSLGPPEPAVASPARPTLARSTVDSYAARNQPSGEDPTFPNTLCSVGGFPVFPLSEQRD